MKNKKRSSSSNIWIMEHFRDKYVYQAKKMGLRSRSWFKLAEIQKSDKLFRVGMTVIDLGSSPGGWSQYALTQIGKTGRVIACDILPMDPIIGVEFIQGDFCNELVLKKILKCLGRNKAQIIMSDMTPNISGISEIDIPRIIYLIELALKMCFDMLVIGGSFLVKAFQGESFEESLKNISSVFTKVKIRKPSSSRARSREVYIVATGLKS